MKKNKLKLFTLSSLAVISFSAASGFLISSTLKNSNLQSIQSLSNQALNKQDESLYDNKTNINEPDALMLNNDQEISTSSDRQTQKYKIEYYEYSLKKYPNSNGWGPLLDENKLLAKINTDTLQNARLKNGVFDPIHCDLTKEEFANKNSWINRIYPNIRDDLSIFALDAILDMMINEVILGGTYGGGSKVLKAFGNQSNIAKTLTNYYTYFFTDRIYNITYWNNNISFSTSSAQYRINATFLKYQTYYDNKPMSIVTKVIDTTGSSLDPIYYYNPLMNLDFLETVNASNYSNYVAGNPFFSSPNNANIWNFLQNKFSNNNGYFPTINQFKQWIYEYIKNPNVYNCFPKTFQKHILANTINPIDDIVIDESKIHVIGNGKVNFDDGAIAFNDQTSITKAFNDAVAKAKANNPSYVPPSNLSAWIAQVPNYNKVVFPRIENLSAKISTGLKTNTINATSPIDKYFASEIVYLFNKNRQDQTIVELLKWLNNSQQLNQLFYSLPPNATISSIDNIGFVNNNKIEINFTLSEAYLDSYFKQNYKFPKSIFIDNLNNGSVGNLQPTQLNTKVINYNDNLYKQIFANSKPFVCDWNTNLSFYANKLTDYINNNLNDFFSNTHLTTVHSNTLSIDPNNKNSFLVTTTFSGLENQGSSLTYNRNITQQKIRINLKPEPSIDSEPTKPGAGGSLVPDTTSSLNFNIFLQKWIDANYHYPSFNEGNGPNHQGDINSQYYQIIIDYLNQKDVLANIPDAWIPSGGFTKNNTNVGWYQNKFNFTDGWLNNSQSTCSTNNNKEALWFYDAVGNFHYILQKDVTIPSTYYSNNVSSTNERLVDLSACSAVKNNLAADVLNNQTLKNELDSFITNNQTYIFNNLNTSNASAFNQISSIENRQYSINDKNQLILNFSLVNARGYLVNKTYDNLTITITGFRSSSSSDKNDFNTVVEPVGQLNWSNTLAQTLLRKNGSNYYWYNELKQDLIKHNIIKNPRFLNRPISPNDFEINLDQNLGTSFDNTTGTLNCSVVFYENKYYENMKPVPTKKTIELKLTGFMRLQPTTIKTNPILDDINNFTSKQFASKITKQMVQNLVNQKAVSTFVNNPIELNTNQATNNPWCPNTKITVYSIVPDDINGTILVNATMQNFEAVGNQGIGWVDLSTKKPITFTLNGYFSSANDGNSIFNTSCPNTIHLNNVDNILAQSYKLTNNQINQLIKNELVNSIKNLNPNATDTLSNSITITNINSFDNTSGTINIQVEISNSNWWTNAKPELVHTIQSLNVIGFKIVHPTEVDEIWNVNHLDKFTNEYTQLEAEADLKALQSQYIHNLVENESQLSIKILDSNSFVKEGKVKVLITINPYYDANANYVDNSQQPYSKECYFVGFKSVGNSPLEFTTGVRDGSIKNVLDIMPQTITNNKLSTEQKERILQGICDSQICYNLVPGQTLTTNDIDFIPAEDNQPIEGNNITGSINVKIKIKNSKAWKEGVIQQEWISPNVITISGFKTILPTKIGTTRIDVSKIDPSLANRLAINFTKQEAEQLLNKNQVKDAIYINLPPQANINIDGGLDYNNASIGEITLKVNVSKYYSQNNGYEQTTNPPSYLLNTITLTGFKNGQGITTGFSGYVDCGTLLNNYYYSDINDPKKQTIIHDIIVNELINNQNKYFSNLNGTLTSNDIEIAIDYNKIDNTLGYLYLDSIIVKNNKALENGNVIGNYLVVKNVKVVTLKTQLPSAWENKNDTSFVLNGGNKYFVKEIENNPSILTTLINNNADVLLRNPVKNIPIEFNVNSVSYDYKNETITATLGVSKFYNSKGIETTNDSNFSKFNHTYVFSGFKHFDQSMETNLKLTNIVWNEPIFKEIFGKNDKGFVIDWKQPNVLNEKQQQLLNFLNDPKNKNIVWLNPAPNTTVKSVTLSPIFANNKVQANVVYSGLGNGFFDENLQATINIELRTMPTNTNDNSRYNIFNLIRVAINNFCQTKLRAPDDQEIINICTRVINENKDQIANYYLPNNGNIQSSDFIIKKNTPSQTYIDRSFGSMHIYANAIVLNPNTENELVFPDLGQYNWNEVAVDTRSEWEKWVKYVVFYSLIALLIMGIIVLIIYIKRKKKSKSFQF